MNTDQFVVGYTGLIGADVASYLRRSFTTAENNEATMLISAFETQLVSQCNRQFDTATTYTDSFDLPGRRFWTHNFPIATVESITVDGTEVTLIENTDYFIYSTHLEFDPMLFSEVKRQNALVIEYTIKPFWGDDVKLLILKLVAHAWLSAENGGVPVSQMSFATVSQTLDTAEFKSEVKAVLNRYRKRLL